MTSSRQIALLGIPFDANSSHLRGPAQAPSLIRAALSSGSSNLWTEDGIDLGVAGTIQDQGEVALSEDTEEAFAQIEKRVDQALQSGLPLICLGGDHSVTFPVMRGFHHHYRDLTILHFDAHPDLYEELEGNRLSHACPFARILEGGFAHRLVQVGIRTMNGHQMEQATKLGVEVISMRRLSQFATLRFNGPLYVSFDMDVLDPAFAPGVSHHEPGGLSVREALAHIQSLRVPVVGADIVEYNPRRDHDSQTAMVAAKVLKELAAVMLRGQNQACKWV
jgi:agmatinase